MKWVWLCVSLAQHHILTFAVGMQIEGVSCWEVRGQRVYKESNTEDTQELIWCWCPTEQQETIQIKKTYMLMKNYFVGRLL